MLIQKVKCKGKFQFCGEQMEISLTGKSKWKYVLQFFSAGDAEQKGGRKNAVTRQRNPSNPGEP